VRPIEGIGVELRFEWNGELRGSQMFKAWEALETAAGWRGARSWRREAGTQSRTAAGSTVTRPAIGVGVSISPVCNLLEQHATAAPPICFFSWQARHANAYGFTACTALRQHRLSSRRSNIDLSSRQFFHLSSSSLGLGGEPAYVSSSAQRSLGIARQRSNVSEFEYRPLLHSGRDRHYSWYPAVSDRRLAVEGQQEPNLCRQLHACRAAGNRPCLQERRTHNLTDYGKLLSRNWRTNRTG